MDRLRSERTVRIGLIVAADGRRRVELRLCGVRGRLVADGRLVRELDDGRALVAGLDAGAVRFVCDEVAGRGSCVRIEPAGPCALEPRRGIEVRDVPAGRGFHWRKDICATYPGAVELIGDPRGLIVVNEVGLEDYLAGVITAEMGPDCPSALLEAQAIVARSWLIAMREPKHADAPFDRCNDDCCQRYQGTTHLAAAAIRAIDATRGRVLVAADGSVLDANYAKSCGGISEHPRAVWGIDKPGLVPVIDAPPDAPEHERFAWVAVHGGQPPPAGEADSRARLSPLPNAMPEAFIEEYLAGSWLARTRVWCSPRCVPVEAIGRYLGRVDEPDDYFRWQTSVSRETVERLLRQHVAECRELAELRDVHITRRGVSGRAIEAVVEWLDVQSRARRTLLTSEYRIRQVLHPRFLYSSAVLVEPLRDTGGRLVSLRLRGAGWGHGVGMCQIGALGMALAGRRADEICRHYYPQARLADDYGGDAHRDQPQGRTTA